MQKNRHAGICCILAVALMSIMLTGCEMMPELQTTEEQNELIAEYVAGVLLKYNKGHAAGITKIYEEVTEEAAETEDSMSASQTEEANTADVQTESLPVPETEEIKKELSEAIGTNGAQVQYKSYELCNEYPGGDSSEIYFSLQAAPGRTLLITHFDLSNQTDEDIECDILHTGTLFRLYVNGEKRINEQTTILMNDMKQFSKTMHPGESEDVVLVFELDEELAASVSTLDLIVSDGTEELKYNLQ